MADNVNLYYPSSSTESYIDYIWPILFPDANLENTVGSERLLNNAFATWLDNNGEIDSYSITDIILDLAYNENSFSLNISFNAKVVTYNDLIFNSSFNTSISHEFDTWSYLATNPDLIFSIGTDKGRVAQHYLKFGIDEGRNADEFNENHYVASNQDLIPIYGLNPKEATQHYVEYGLNEQRATSDFNEFVYLAANLDIINEDYSSYYRYEYYPSYNFPYYSLTSLLEKYAQDHYINYGFLEGRDTNIDFLIQALTNNSSNSNNNFNSYSNSSLNLYNELAGNLVRDYIYFDHNSYVASNQDLLNYSIPITAPSPPIRTDSDVKFERYYHYLLHGRDEGRSLDSFDEYKYLAANNDLIAAFGSNGKKATEHFVDRGFREGRVLTPSFNIFLSGYLVSNPDVLDNVYKGMNNNDYVVYQDFNYSNLYSSNSSGYDFSKHSSLTHYFENGYLENRQFDNFDKSKYIKYLRSGNYDNVYFYSNNGQEYFNTSFLGPWTSVDDYEKVASNFIYDYVKFDDTSYLASNEDLIENLANIKSKFNVFNHLISYGYLEQRELDNFDEWQYLASNGDLINTFGSDATAATQHYVSNGYAEGRSKDSFDEWGYIASNIDILLVIGANTSEAVKHYISYGMTEGRGTDGFNAESYLNKNSDLKIAFGNDHDLAKRHYVEYGFAEGRVF